MATTLIRRRNTTVATKAEVTQGVDAFGGAPAAAATDFLKADIAISFAQQAIPNPELTGSLDTSAAIPGGTKVTVTLTVMAKGSGAPGVPAQWGKIMNCCGFQEIIQAAAIAATPATAGTARTATVGAPFPATAQALRGLPAILSGNPAGPFTSLISDWSGGVATFVHAFNPVLSASTSVMIPPNVLYRPVSDPALIGSNTVNIYMDGLLWKLTGCAGAWKLDAKAGQLGTLTFTMTGIYNTPVAAAVPTGIVFDAPQPPVFRQGISRLDGQVARVSNAMFDTGNVLFEPENPEANEGFDPSVITSRAAKGSFDPLMNVADTIARVGQFKAGQQVNAAIELGVIPGNRIGVVAPTAQYTSYSPTNRNDIMAETMAFDCPGPNASIFLSVF